MKTRLLIVIVASLTVGVSAGQESNFNSCMADETKLWQNAATDVEREQRIASLMFEGTTELTGSALTAYLDRLLSMVLHDVYGLEQFQSGSYLRRAQAIERITGQNWTRLGLATSDEVRDKAASQAQQGYPVVGLLRGATTLPFVVLPGGTRYSSAWEANVPRIAVRSASARFSFVGCRLSMAFSMNTARNVELFVYQP